MMDQFKVCYVPGGMSLYHSGWWLCKVLPWRDGKTYAKPIKMLKKVG
jgi:hypothetical protein